MEAQARGNVQVERTLWHGTSLNRLESINLNGFNRVLCGTKGMRSRLQECHHRVDMSSPLLPEGVPGIDVDTGSLVFGERGKVGQVFYVFFI